MTLQDMAAQIAAAIYSNSNAFETICEMHQVDYEFDDAIGRQVAKLAVATARAIFELS